MLYTVRGGTAKPRRQDAGPRTAVRRFIMLLLLAGLWMMHGMSGSTDAGCHGTAMPVPMKTASVSDVAAAPASMLHERPVTNPHAATPSLGTALAEQMRHGDLCVCGQPPTPGQDLLALLALLALATSDRADVRLLRPVRHAVPGTRRRAPPGLFGIRLLTTVCVSRT